ncbi:MAG TPA: LCP family protein [Pilimelia sp.]|nr:LCP family protein [Pilimelia sp.]
MCAVFGALLMLVSGGGLVAWEGLQARYAGAVGRDQLIPGERAEPPRGAIEGPLNILLVGIDPRDSEPNWIPRADAVLIMHVSRGLDQAYLFSLPRDLLVDVPAFPPSGYRGGQDRLGHAMWHGAQVPGQEKPNTAQGFQLLARAVSQYTGIRTFDAAAIINFTGFRSIVDAMGGVTMYIDMDVESIHRQPDGRHRAPSGIPGAEGADAYVGPRKKYTKGTHHLQGWEALDYVRQRYIPGGDYARQRHQQQFIRAMISQAMSRDVVTNPRKLDAVLRAGGKAVIFDGQGRTVLDFAFALRDLRADSLVMVRLPGDSVGVGGAYQGEQLRPVAKEFLAALRANQLDAFMAQHPELANPAR